MRLFEYVDRRGRGAYSEWRARLQVAQRAALDLKVDVLLRDPTLPPNLLRGPVRQNGKTYRHTYKLTVNGNVALRPLACKGPIDPLTEWTLLVPAVEIGGKLDDVLLALAEQRRLEIISDPSRRREIVKS